MVWLDKTNTVCLCIESRRQPYEVSIPPRGALERPCNGYVAGPPDDLPTTMTTTLVRPDTLCSWKAPSLFIANTRGECGDDQTLSGYYFREVRFLRTLRLEIDGVCEPRPSSGTCSHSVMSIPKSRSTVAEAVASRMMTL